MLNVDGFAKSYMIGLVISDRKFWKDVWSIFLHKFMILLGLGWLRHLMKDIDNECHKMLWVKTWVFIYQ